MREMSMEKFWSKGNEGCGIMNDSDEIEGAVPK